MPRPTRSTQSKATAGTSNVQNSRVTKQKNKTIIEPYRRDADGTPEKYYGKFEMNQPHIINKYLEVRTSPTKGRGIFTRVANIPAGTLILEEEALLYFPDDQALASNFALRKLVKQLDPEKQRKFTALMHQSRRSNEESRFDCNKFNVGKRAAAAVWFWISLINHDCEPLCDMLPDRSFRKNRIGRVRTLVPIPQKGTEISISYLGWNPEDEWKASTREERIEAWGFTCNCSLCQNPEQTYALYNELRNLDGDLNFLEKTPLEPMTTIANREVADQNIQRYLDLCLDLRLIEDAYMAALHATKFYSYIEDDLAKGNAVRWALEAARIGSIVFGIESIEDDADDTIVRDRNGLDAPKRRYSRSGRKLDGYLELVSKTIPDLMKKKLYGKVFPQDGEDVSDIPALLY